MRHRLTVALAAALAVFAASTVWATAANAYLHVTPAWDGCKAVAWESIQATMAIYHDRVPDAQKHDTYTSYYRYPSGTVWVHGRFVGDHTSIDLNCTVRSADDNVTGDEVGFELIPLG
jgi:hypothetical protein